MKALIKTNRHIAKEGINELKEIFPDIEITVEWVLDKPTPTWNKYFKLIEVSWTWFRNLFGLTEYDIHCYVTNQETLRSVGITKYLGLYSLDSDSKHEFWFSVPDTLQARAKANGFRTNFAWLFTHELVHGFEHFAKQIDRTHEMEAKGRLKELASEYTNADLRLAMQEEVISLAVIVKNLMLKLFGSRYLRPHPHHWDKITQAYLNPNPIYTKTGVHVGVDFATPIGTPVLAPADGEITRSSYSPSLGYWVEFRFGNLYLVALHLSGNQVPRQVKRGEPIGFIGDTGMIDGIHSHLEGWHVPMDRALLTSKSAVELYTFDITELIR